MGAPVSSRIVRAELAEQNRDAAALIEVLLPCVHWDQSLDPALCPSHIYVRHAVPATIWARARLPSTPHPQEARRVEPRDGACSLGRTSPYLWIKSVWVLSVWLKWFEDEASCGVGDRKSVV